MARKWFIFAVGVAVLPLSGLAGDLGFSNASAALAVTGGICLITVILIAMDE